MDPLVVKWASAMFAVLLLLAARHKLASPAEFRAVVRDYRLLPETLVAPAAWLVPLLELAIAIAWVAALAGSVTGRVASMATTVLLATYTLAIAANLLRGRRHVSCGCSLSTGEGDHLSWALVLRNAVLIGIASIAVVPVSARELGAGDYAMLAAALLASLLLYVAAAQLLRNAAAMGAWRRSVETGR